VTAAPPRIWVLLGDRTGDNNQLLRLAREVGVPFQTMELRYNRSHLIPPRLLGATLLTLDDQSRSKIAAPWPDVVLGIGYRSVPVALAIRELSGGKAKLVRLGNPRLDPANFDLVITTPQYGVRDAANVLRLPVGISTAQRIEPSREENDWLAKLPRPHRLLLIGGNTFMWSLDPDTLAGVASAISAKGASVIAVSSGRTSNSLTVAVADALRDREHGLVWGRFPRYPVLLADADEIYVTADSVAMVSDAVATGKPTGLVEPSKTAAGKLFYTAAKAGAPVPIRDVRRFWTSVQRNGLAGTVDRPLAGKLDVDPVASAVSAVRALLD
jgi:mitochondrial fission protein ELM1